MKINESLVDCTVGVASQCQQCIFKTTSTLLRVKKQIEVPAGKYCTVTGEYRKLYYRGKERCVNYQHKDTCIIKDKNGNKWKQLTQEQALFIFRQKLMPLYTCYGEVKKLASTENEIIEAYENNAKVLLEVNTIINKML